MAFNLGSAYGEIRIAGDGAISTIYQVRRGLLGLGGPMGAAGVAAVGLGAGLAAVAGAGAGLAAIIGRSVSVAADLESQLDGVQAVTGATATEMAGLKELITNLGVDPNLKVSALEAAAAVEMLGRNGMPVADIMNGAARSTVLLANATGGDFAQSADIATDVMALFKIRAEDMEQAVDGITSVVNNSKFSISDYQLAIAQGGGVAAASGVEFDDFNTAIAATSAAFAGGSDAGTSFKVFLQRLIPQSTEAVNVMRDLGLYTGLSAKEYKKAEEKLAKLDQQIANLNPNADDYAAKLTQMLQQHTLLEQSLKEGQNAFYDENGNLKDMASIAGLLQNALSGLTEEQRNNALATIFGTDAIRTASRLAEVGATNFRNLQATMGQTSAAEAAATRMDNLRGAMEILDGIVETLKIRIGDEFIPVLTDNVRGLSSFLDTNKDTIVGFFGGIADGVGRVLDLVQTFQSGGLFGSGDNAGLLSALGVSPEMQTAIQDAIADIDGLEAAISDFFNNAASAYESGGATGLINFITDSLNNGAPQILAATDAWGAAIWEWVNQAIAAGAQKLNEWSQSLSAWVNSPDSQASLVAMGEAVGQYIMAALGVSLSNQERAGGALANLVGALISSIPAIVGNLILAGGQLAAGIIAGIVKGITGEDLQVMTIEEFRKMAQWIIDVLAAIDWAAIGGNIITGLITGIQSKAEELQQAISDTVSSLPAKAAGLLGIQSPSKVFAGIGENISLGLAQGIAGAALAPAHEIAAMTSSLPAYAMPVGGGGVSQNIDNSRVTENKFTMSIGTITNGESGVIQGYNTLRALAA